MEFLIGLGVVWLLGGLMWSRIYYARRHGLGWGVDISAAFVGVAWPVTVFTLWRPTLCQHRDHVLERSRRNTQFEAENATIERTLRAEGR